MRARGKAAPTGDSKLCDGGVDVNETGTNENGFGGGMNCDMYTGNAMPWNFTSFKDKLYASINSLGGTRVLYTPNGNAEDGSWFYSAGGDSDIPNGFDGVINKGTVKTLYPDKIYQNIAVNLFPFSGYLYAGAYFPLHAGLWATEEYLTGSQIWKTGNRHTWQPVTMNGFEDKKVLTFEAFARVNNSLYVPGSGPPTRSAEAWAGQKSIVWLPAQHVRYSGLPSSIICSAPVKTWSLSAAPLSPARLPTR